MKSDFDDILDQCIQAMAAGESLETCLARFPDYAEELYPLLWMASSVRAIPNPQGSASAIQASQERMLAAFSAKSQTAPVSKSNFSRYSGQVRTTISYLLALIMKKEKNPMTWRLRLMVALVLVAIFVTTIGGVTAASASALPGDMLYPVKTSAERVQMLLTLNPESRQELETRLQENRIDEVQAVLDDGREVDVEFYGVLTEIGSNYLIVGGFTVLIDANTEIAGTLELGLMVEVKAQTQADGTLLAASIDIEDPIETPEPTETEEPEETEEPTETPEPTETEEPEETEEPTETHDPGDDDDGDDGDYDGEFELSGYVTEIGENYIIIGATVIMTDTETEVPGTLEVGFFVEVEGYVLADGTLIASEIDHEDGTPEPSETPAPDDDDDEDDDDDDGYDDDGEETSEPGDDD